VPHSLSDLARNPDKIDLNVLFDCNGDFHLPFFIRQNLFTKPVPVSVTHHTISYQNLLYSWFLRLLLNKSYAFDSLVCTSHAARRVIESNLEILSERLKRMHRSHKGLQFSGRLEVIPLGVETDVFRPLNNKKKLRNQLGLPQDALILLWVGRLSVTDKADLLPMIRLFRDLKEENKDQKLFFLIAGTERTPGQDQAVIYDYAKSLGVRRQITVRTDVRPPNQYLIYSAADIFISPSDNIQETFGITPIEAMASGIPQVVSDWDGYRDTVEHGVTGFRVPTLWTKCDEDIVQWAPFIGDNLNDHYALAQSVVMDLELYKKYLNLLIRDRQLRLKMGQASAKRAKAKFSWEVIIKQYVNLWQEQNREARKAVVRPTIPSIDQAIFFDAYSGYATCLLEGSEKIEITLAGDAVLRAVEAMPSYYDSYGVYDSNVMGQCLKFLFKKQKLTARISFAAATADLARNEKISISSAKRHLLWLAKYGYLKIHAKI
jgi:glycosyltransferase involved in cell wall biosynthesis